MESPFLLSSWLSTRTTGLSWASKWNKNVAEGRAILANLQESGLLEEGQFLIYSKNPSFAKLSPSAIRQDPDKLASLQSFGITLADYEVAYTKMKLPPSTKLNWYLISIIFVVAISCMTIILSCEFRPAIATFIRTM